MAVTIASLAVTLRLITDPDDTIPAGTQMILEHLRAFAELECNGRAPHAPATACDQAVYSIAAYLFDRPSAPSGGSYANAWYNSGAAEMLRRWTIRRALLLDPDGSATAAAPAPPPIPSGDLPDGVAGRPALRWNTALAEWQAVSLSTTVYAAITRDDTFRSLEQMINLLLGHGGSRLFSPANGAYGRRGSVSFSTWGAGGDDQDALDAIWPAGEGAPWAWVVSPQYQAWLADFAFRCAGGPDTTINGVIGPGAESYVDQPYGTAPYTATIAGVPYEIGVAQIPITVRGAFNYTGRYTPPPSVNVLELVVP